MGKEGERASLSVLEHAMVSKSSVRDALLGNPGATYSGAAVTPRSVTDKVTRSTA